MSEQQPASEAITHPPSNPSIVETAPKLQINQDIAAPQIISTQPKSAEIATAPVATTAAVTPDVKPATPEAKPSPAAEPKVETVASVAVMPAVNAADIPETKVSDTVLANHLAAQGITFTDDKNFYAFDTKLDSDRLVAQSMVFGDYLDNNAYRLVGGKIDSILDLGCAEGLMTNILRRVYPDAHIVGIDMESRAIDVAKQKQDKMLSYSEPIEYLVANAEEPLPGGPYDLIYISMVMLHAGKHKQILENVKKALKPGGYVWIKDIHPDWIKAINHPHWLKLGDLLYSTMDKVGRNARISVAIPQMLADLDFADIKVENENYLTSNDSLVGRVMLGCALGVFRNTLKVVSKVNGIPEEEILQMYNELCKDAQKLRGNVLMLNIIGRRAGNIVSQ